MVRDAGSGEPADDCVELVRLDAKREHRALSAGGLIHRRPGRDLGDLEDDSAKTHPHAPVRRVAPVGLLPAEETCVELRRTLRIAGLESDRHPKYSHCTLLAHSRPGVRDLALASNVSVVWPCSL